MAESFFTSGNQMVTTEIDVDSPVTEGWMSKVKGRDVELSDKIVGLGGTGVDGDVVITANTNLSGIKHYNNFTINAGVIVTVDQGKPLIIFTKGTVTINGTIEGNGKGASGVIIAGSNGLLGGSGGGGGSDVITPTIGYKGGDSAHYWKIDGGTAQSGTGDGDGGNGVAAIDRLTHIPNVSAANEILGGASGGAGCNASASYGKSGNGGGFVYIEAPTVIINTGAIIRCNGANGVDGRAGYGQAGGGGGGGGIIFVKSKTITNNGTLSATAGNGGNGYEYGEGGNGGAGVVYVETVP